MIMKEMSSNTIQILINLFTLIVNNEEFRLKLKFYGSFSRFLLHCKMSQFNDNFESQITKA